jgi:hypothetical protein
MGLIKVISGLPLSLVVLVSSFASFFFASTLETLTARENCFTSNKVQADGLDAALWLELASMCSKKAKFMCQTTVYGAPVGLLGVRPTLLFRLSSPVITFHSDAKHTWKQSNKHIKWIFY